ncbi:MAG: hypothetical protein A2Z69_00550 [Bacteroidetes bacterium RBG_13_44_24]|nr:MAG: hypothetical protein A2Z69_00550 [Bacteroidetes bacterium RBG_13_44_24]
MSRETPDLVKRKVVMLYFSGLSYEDIGSKLGIGKATVFGIVEDLRGGRFPGYEDLAELAGDMREIAVNLRKMNIAPIEAVGLFTLSKAVFGLGVEPSQLDAWVTMCRSVAKDKEPSSSRLIQEAMRLALLEAEEGLSYEDATSKYSTSVSELKELEPKLETIREELVQLQESKETLVQTCRKMEKERDRLEVEKGDLTKQTEQLSKRRQDLKKTATDLEAAVTNLEEKVGSLRDQLSHLEEKIAGVNQEINERTSVLIELEGLGFTKTQLVQLRTKLGELAARYSSDGLLERFLHHAENYDEFLGLEATRESLRNEIAALTEQRDSFIKFAEKLSLTLEEVGKGIDALKTLQKKGVMPAAIVSYHRLLDGVGADPQTFQKMIVDFGGLEKSISAKRNELESIRKQVMTEQKTLEQMKTQQTGTKAYLEFLKGSTVKAINEVVDSSKVNVSKLCQELQQDIVTWGNVRGELGKYEHELKLARYFVSIPVSEQAARSLTQDMDVTIIAQYLLLVRIWSLMKSNPKGKIPESLRRKYTGIADYEKLALADLTTWALTVLTGGN